MPAVIHAQETGIVPAMRTAIISGGAAGDRTVTGIKAGDMIAFVWEATVTTEQLVDRTAEFKKATGDVTVDNTINNTGGTDTTGDRLIVCWFKKSTE